MALVAKYPSEPSARELLAPFHWEVGGSSSSIDGERASHYPAVQSIPWAVLATRGYQNAFYAGLKSIFRFKFAS
jgi:hypothetical protein